MEEPVRAVFLRCPNCSGPLTYEDEVCPHCGTPNTAAKTHIREKEAYTADYRDTVEDAKRNTILNRKLILASAALSVLVVALVWLIVTWINMYDIVGEAREEQNVRNADDLTAVLDMYLEQGDYLSFIVLLNRQGIFRCEGPYEPYGQMRDLTSAYYTVYRELIRLPLTKWTTEFPVTVDDRKIAYLAQGICDFKKSAEKDYPAAEQLPQESTARAVSDMGEQIRMMMKTYFGMTDEEYESCRELAKDDCEVRLREIWEEAH